MFARAGGLAGLAGAALCWGCVAHDTASDHGSVRALVRERAQLELEPDLPTAQVDAQVQQLVAEPLTLDNAVHIALLNNRELRAQLLGLGVERGQLVQASVFPNLDFEAEVRVSED